MLCWNVRGLNGLSKQREVVYLCNKLEASLIGLGETKIKLKSLDRVIESMFAGWKYVSNHNSHYNGRILVIWREDINVVVKSEPDQAITCLVKNKLLMKEYYCTYVYAQNGREDRKELWKYLTQWSLGMKQPWTY